MPEKILQLKARQVLDSRGIPTVEAEVHTKRGFGKAICPSGTSVGVHEAIELRDNEKSFLGKSVNKAVSGVNFELALKLKGKDCLKQKAIDSLLSGIDGTTNKSRLGANALTAVSIACAKAAARATKKPLFEYIARLASNKNPLIPMPLFNLIEGGKHAENDLQLQEYLLIPSGAESFSEAFQVAAEIHQTMRLSIVEKFGKSAANIGLEGGFAPPLQKADDPIKLILNAAKQLGYEKIVSIGIDCAASTFFKSEKYNWENKVISFEEMRKVYEELVTSYPVVLLEDPFAEDDWSSYCSFTKDFGARIKIVGDDLTVSNTERINRAIHLNACNAVVLKPNQVGTLTEAIAASKLAKENKLSVLVSHRSGDSEDHFIADFAVGLGAEFIKSGAPCTSERLSKYNQLLRIEEALGKKSFRNPFKTQ